MPLISSVAAGANQGEAKAAADRTTAFYLGQAPAEAPAPRE